MTVLAMEKNRKIRKNLLKPNEEIILKVTKFDFKKEWHLLEPHLNDPEILESLDKGMLSFSQDYGWSHLPLWDRKNGIGPWEYSTSDAHETYACDRATEDHEYYRLREKYTKFIVKIIEGMGVNLDELNIYPLDLIGSHDNPNFERLEEAYLDEFSKIEKKFLPKENTYKWYQCFHACFYLAKWQETLARKVYSEYDWRTYQKHKIERRNGGHSTTIGRSPKGNLLIFDILLFDNSSTEQILEAAGVNLTKLQ
jgi:hypothetical protein